jgi:hypothetical protein
MEVTVRIAEYIPENANDIHLYSWTSENPEIATVTQGGKITAVGEGVTNIIYQMGHRVRKIKVDCGVIIKNSPSSTGVYPASPSICILANGDYLISYEDAGSGTTGNPAGTTWIYSSSDRGITWKQLSSIHASTSPSKRKQAWSNIFELDGAVYLMGTGNTSNPRPVVIRKSTDNGKTWTDPININNGMVTTSGNYGTAPVPMLIHKGRIWRAMSAENPEQTIWGRGNALMMSAPLGSDLMKASSWTLSNELSYDGTYLNGRFNGWMEGNAVADRDGNVKIVMRVEVPDGKNGEYAAIIDVNDNGTTATFNPETGFVKMPGGGKKFTIRYDEKSGRYWTLANEVLPEFASLYPGEVRNVLSLCSSPDLRTWTVHTRILQHKDVKFHGYQYADWVVDGDDMIFVSRTAHDDAQGGAKNYHDANYITFHRIENFREGGK